MCTNTADFYPMDQVLGQPADIVRMFQIPTTPEGKGEIKTSESHDVLQYLKAIITRVLKDVSNGTRFSFYLSLHKPCSQCRPGMGANEQASFLITCGRFHTLLNRGCEGTQTEQEL